MKELALRDNDALSLRVEKDLKVVLQDVQGYSSMRDLAHTKPEVWLEIAGLLCKGVSPSRIYKDYGGNSTRLGGYRLSWRSPRLLGI